MNFFIKFFLYALILQSTLFARDINLNKLLDTANKTDKHLFVWLHKNGCSYCENMYEFTLKDEKINSLVKRKFVYIHINISKRDRVVFKNFEGDSKSFAKNMGFNFYPTSLFFNRDGELIYNASGYHDEVLFYKILKYIETNSYKEMDYNLFENEFDFYTDE